MNWFLGIDDFPRRWECGDWSFLHGWIHIASDALIFGAYFAIPALIAYVVASKKTPFPRIGWLFVVFIAACGLGHFCESIIFFAPIYRISALVKILTAIASWATVFFLAPEIPKMLKIEWLDQMIREKSQEVQKIEEVLTKALDRADRIDDLKKEVNELLESAGRQPRYKRP